MPRAFEMVKAVLDLSHPMDPKKEHLPNGHKEDSSSREADTSSFLDEEPPVPELVFKTNHTAFRIRIIFDLKISKSAVQRNP